VVFPHNDTISVDGREVNYRQIIDMLAPAVTPERLEKMQQVGIGFGRVANSNREHSSATCHFIAGNSFQVVWSASCGRR
jgi:hypothetical protein